MSNEIRYYPCIINQATGHIDKPVCESAVTREVAEEYLKHRYYRLWVNCEAIPQPVSAIDYPQPWTR